MYHHSTVSKVINDRYAVRPAYSTRPGFIRTLINSMRKTTNSK